MVAEVVPFPRPTAAEDQEIEEYLARYERKELLRFVTIGSVDDGKSTLIGRLLYESGGVYRDQLEAVTTTSVDGTREINFANLTDGLEAEREQGITIDVAYRYSSTERRKFIIADTPGHVQYTRNMATGASTAHAAIILIDARLGVLQQSRRHAYIASLLRIPHLLVAVNKMDLVDYDEARFAAIVGEFERFLADLGFTTVHFLPVSALRGDNIVRASEHTPWFTGSPLLATLETIPVPTPSASARLVLPVQCVIRPDLDFRGFAGTIESGTLRPGDAVQVLPSGKQSRVARIVGYDRDLPEAFAPMAVTITLEDEIDISRGDTITNPDNDLRISRNFEADLVWMHEVPLEPGRQYLVKHTTSRVSGSVVAVRHKVDMDTLAVRPATTLGLNDVGRVAISLNRPIILDEYRNDRSSGSFILIDRVTNATVAAGMIQAHGEDFQEDRREVAAGLTAAERSRRFHQKPTVLLMTGRSGVGKIVLARALERRLFDAGHMPYVLDPERLPRIPRGASGAEISALLDHMEVLVESGLIVISTFTAPARRDRRDARARLSERAEFLEIFVDADAASARARLTALGRDPAEADAFYEAPEDPDLQISGTELETEVQVDRIVRILELRGAII